MKKGGVIENFNGKVNDKFRVHQEIMPAPFMGNVKTAPIVLLLLNPGFDEAEEKCNFYQEFKSYWVNEIQHISSIPGLRLFCLDKDYINFSSYWDKKLKHLINSSNEDSVSELVCKIQLFPYHTKKFKAISTRILREHGFTNYLPSQEYNFHLVREAMQRNAKIIIMRSKKMWFEAIPELADYSNVSSTNSYLNTILSPGNLNSFNEIVDILNRKNN